MPAAAARRRIIRQASGLLIGLSAHRNQFAEFDLYNSGGALTQVNFLRISGRSIAVGKAPRTHHIHASADAAEPLASDGPDPGNSYSRLMSTLTDEIARRRTFAIICTPTPARPHTAGARSPGARRAAAGTLAFGGRPAAAPRP